MQFNKYFSEKDLETIIEEEPNFKYSYHLNITFKDYHNKTSALNRINRKLPAESKLYGWQCKTVKKQNDKVHHHAVIYSNTPIIEDDLYLNINLDLKLVSIYTCAEDVLEYIHDGHHELKFNFYKRRNATSIKTLIKKTKTKTKIKTIKTIKTFVYTDLRELLRNLRTYGNDRLLYYGGPD